MSPVLKDVASALDFSAVRLVYKDVLLEEDGYVVKQIVSKQEKRAALRLRHRIFCDELKWVLRTDQGMESDEYDGDSVFFGVFDRDKKLISFLRLIMPDNRFMMEKEFLSLVDPGHRIRKEADTAEISRLCVAPEVRADHRDGNFGVHKISLTLFKGVYHWCRLNRIRYLYAVTELKVYRLYCLKGFPYRPLGKPQTMPDGVTIIAVMLDWQEFASANAVKRVELLDWFNRTQAAPAPSQLRPHAPGLMH